MTIGWEKDSSAPWKLTAIISNKLSFFSFRCQWVCTGSWKMLTRHMSELGWVIQMYLSSRIYPAEWQMWRYVQNNPPSVPFLATYSCCHFPLHLNVNNVICGSVQFWTVATNKSLTSQKKSLQFLFEPELCDLIPRKIQSQIFWLMVHCWGLPTVWGFEN